MGVVRNDYVIVGLDVGQDVIPDNDTWWDEVYERHTAINDTDLFYLFDGMSGSYFIVGHVLKYADEYDGLGVTVIDFDESLAEIKGRVRKQVFDEFGIDREPQVIVITHWH